MLGCGSERGLLVMNKNDLVTEVSDGAGLSKADATKAVDSVFGRD